MPTSGRRSTQRRRATRKTAGQGRSTKRTTARKRSAGRSSRTRGAAAGQSDSLPRAPRDAELIVRQGFEIDATGRFPHAVPEVIILGNRSGLRYLAEVFARLAEQAGRRSRSSEPLDEVKLVRLEAPINVRLSDELEFRFAALTPANRAAVFKRFGITIKSRQRGSLFERYQQIAQMQYGRVVQRLRYDMRRRRSHSRESP